MNSDIFTQEDIDIFLTPLIKSSPTYFVYYDPATGEILAVTNEVLSEFEYKLTTTYDEVVDFLSGTKRFIDYRVGLTPNSTTRSILFKQIDHEIKTNLFVNIDNISNDADFTITWDLINSQWIFNFNKDITEYPSSTLNFFIVKENNFNFLISTMRINMQLLLLGPVRVPFTNNHERDIKNISIITKMIFNTYGLIINE